MMCIARLSLREKRRRFTFMNDKATQNREKERETGYSILLTIACEV